MSKKTVGLLSASPQHKKGKTYISSANAGAPMSDNEYESTNNANLSNSKNHCLIYQKYCHACCVNRCFSKKKYENSR